jgi:hypothetical protein
VTWGLSHPSLQVDIQYGEAETKLGI